MVLSCSAFTFCTHGLLIMKHLVSIWKFGFSKCTVQFWLLFLIIPLLLQPQEEREPSATGPIHSYILCHMHTEILLYRCLYHMVRQSVWSRPFDVMLGRLPLGQMQEDIAVTRKPLYEWTSVVQRMKRPHNPHVRF